MPHDQIKSENICQIPGMVLWGHLLPFFPPTYKIDANGVFFIRIIRRKSGETDKIPELISGPCWVSALTRSNQGMEWGYQIHWVDQDGREHDMAFPARKLSEPRGPLAGDLASMGLKIVPGSERRLMAYLGSFCLPPEYRIQSTAQVGWTTGKNDAPLFVLPDHTIGVAEGEKVVFQPEEYSPTSRNMHAKGTIKQWQGFVAKPCVGNPTLLFAVCAAFAAPLFKFASLDSGGFHFYGTSSKGKTTTLQAAASVWGSGADPAVSESSYIGRWNTTGNAVEATASAHNDILLALDEIGTCDSKNFGKVIYDLFGGRGKSRLQKNSTLQPERTWRILGLSSGEISVRQKIEEDTGRRAMAGQLIRMLDIPIKDEGVILNSHGITTKDFVDDFKKKCGEFYGTAGPMFIEHLIDSQPDAAQLRQVIQDEIDRQEEDLSRGKDLESYQQRAIRRFAAVAAAGFMAIGLGILKTTESEVSRSVIAARDAWLGDEGNKPLTIKGIEAIREFILRNPVRFPSEFNERGLATNLAGYYSTADNGLYLFTKTGFGEACSGFPRDAVLDELDRRRLLFKNEGDRKMSRHSVPGIGRSRFYAVRTSILDDDKG